LLIREPLADHAAKHGTASGGFTDNSGNLFTQVALQWQVAPADALI
jgi:hypothetical protein